MKSEAGNGAQGGHGSGSPPCPEPFYVKGPHPWDLFRESVLRIAEENLSTAGHSSLVDRLNKEIGPKVWRDSPSALLASAVALYKEENIEQASDEIERAWKLWRGFLEIDDPQCDSPRGILIMLRDLMRFTGTDESSPLVPTHYRIRPTYMQVCKEYNRSRHEDPRTSSANKNRDPFGRFAMACLAMAWEREQGGCQHAEFDLVCSGS